ncbi:MAG: hypothetical protein COW00_06170 [Bdellovibrio sp. CG12_big_fil_rev_8_21_14_0_65_39_13]|nr:MAG: hypothetical protein COW78_18705 [Bdellovibrio sp. CG22_combo_CG10-13_8_21_14_all_39_27]PIQ60808.1 MAG: hypothetical protein COW00_06170 [Bdellovibrio sp. CG12_big_fil_rev_8_21_14_0_65_39_13]PIR36432.1 MAG: hypothetical protein COV37_03510 [Bdellovibrio sp. CG11_big_fil_rev_8_21_14_0_20_39_38]PJB54658.1 MAG: hypothetical protein CO099_00300 [Bdellovibrio sp. CG_4_9_14_3_um_filter_39_7]
MKKYYIVNIDLTKIDPEDVEALSYEAISQYYAIGTSFYSINEEELDDQFGSEVLCGGNPDDTFINAMEEFAQTREGLLGITFEKKDLLDRFIEFLDEIEVPYTIKVDETEDWNVEWRKSFSTIEIDESFLIVPSWEDIPEGQTGIKIYPGMGFGTGTHETTFLCLKAYKDLINQKKQFPSILDFGAGSGILGIAAQKMGATKVDYVDVDADAKTNAIQNYELNFETGKINYLLRNEFKVNGQYDLVFANILESVLTFEKDAIINSLKNGGILILSGLLNNQVENIKNLYQLEVVDHLVKNDWSCLVLKK